MNGQRRDDSASEGLTGGLVLVGTRQPLPPLRHALLTAAMLVLVLVCTPMPRHRALLTVATLA